MRKLLLALGFGFSGYLIWRYVNADSVKVENDTDSTGGLLSVAYDVFNDGKGAFMKYPNENMSTSLLGLAFIKHYEGIKGYDPITKKYYPYFATAKERERGQKTIGMGHLIKIGEDFSNGLTLQEINTLFSNDITDRELPLIKTLKVKLNQAQFDALMSLRYNVGSIANTRLLAYLQDGNFEKAANEFYGWVKQAGVVLPGLVKRRQAEVRLFTTGEYLHV